MDRVQKAVGLIDLGGRGLEIGPSYQPLVSKASGYRIETVDHTDQAGLVAKYRRLNLPSEMVDAIEPVDFVWTGGSLLDLIPDRGGYDYVLASHVIEHSVDFIGFLADCAGLLARGGRLSLVVPDKRYCFDRFQPLTSVGDIVDAHLRPSRFHPPGALLDHRVYACTNAGGLVWSDADPTDGVALQFTDLHGARAIVEEGQAQQEYFDTHRWKFTPASFDLLLADLRELGFHDFGVLGGHGTTGCEFFRTLQNAGPPAAVDRLAALREIEVELHQVLKPEPVPEPTEDHSAAVRGLQEQVADLQRQLLELHESTSWRATRPLRAVSTFLHGRRSSPTMTVR